MYSKWMISGLNNILGTRTYRDACVDANSAAVRDTGATWLRWKGQKVEFCRCAVRGRVRCHEIPVTKCFVSKCYNGGTCKEAVYSNDFICLCPPGFTGTQCEINTAERCSRGQGSGYRGTRSMSMSGLECINWNSSSLRGKKFTARRLEANTLGLGNHNYCRCACTSSSRLCSLSCIVLSPHFISNSLAVFPHRNPDGDLGPWCHVYKGSQLTWELCDVPKCPRKTPSITTLGPRAPITTNNQGSCGQRTEAPSNSLPMFRIRGGQVSDIREQPWQAAITVYLPRAKSYNFLCGGVLIDSCWILSAAHCFQERFDEKRLRVVLGRTFRLQNSSSEQIFDVEKYWIHEQYDDETYDNDIALLKLKSEFGICALHSPEVLPACLPEPNLALPDWTECEISGYGKEEEFSPFYSERIKRGLVRLWPQEQCVPEKLSGRLVTPNMVCAGDTRGLDDACKGDSGGPLVCPKNGRMTLMGLISWGDGCGKKDTPGVYTRVTNYTNWISSKMRAN
uniref:Plasminogen activator n=1 Tax=Sinocyclocheilus anshuiensis TaxID=1608454 RepID=A0A671MV15_9TELE